jgi:hypothetical protein
VAQSAKTGNGMIETLQLYAIWALLSVGAAGALLAWSIM